MHTLVMCITRVFNKTYDNNKEFKLKQPSEDYKPEVKLKDNKKKKKHFRRKKSD